MILGPRKTDAGVEDVVRQTDHGVHLGAVDVVVAHDELAARAQDPGDRSHEGIESIGGRVVEPDVVGHQVDARVGNAHGRERIVVSEWNELAGAA